MVMMMMMKKERDEELVLFLEMRRREEENERNTFLLIPNSGNDAVIGDASHFEFSGGISSLVPSENDMSDYDWLLTPPGTPLFPALEKEPQISAKSETDISKARTTALKPRETNIITEPDSRRIIASKTHKVMPNLNSSNANRRTPSPSPSRSSILSSRTKSAKATLTSAKPIRSSSTPIRSSSASKIRPAFAKNQVKSQVSLLDAPPKLKASLPERPASASRCSRLLSSLEAKDNSSSSSGRRKRSILRSRSCSINEGETENYSPGMIGTKMVERIVNMRKLAPSKLNAGHHSAVHNNSSAKSDSSGFGRSLSKKSPDMAMRHMDIRRSIRDNLKLRMVET